MIWKIKFTIATMWILRDHGGIRNMGLGWRMSLYTKFKHLKPYEAALEHITEWYVK